MWRETMEEAEDDAPECGAVTTTPTETPRRATKKAKRKTEAFLRDMCDFFTVWYAFSLSITESNMISADYF